MKMDHPPVHGHGKAPHSTDHKMHHEHVKSHAAGHTHHLDFAKQHGAGHMMEHEKVSKMCGGGYAKGKK